MHIQENYQSTGIWAVAITIQKRKFYQEMTEISYRKTEQTKSLKVNIRTQPRNMGTYKSKTKWWRFFVVLQLVFMVDSI